MAVSAGTLHVMGLNLTNTVEMIKLAPNADAFQGRKDELAQIIDDLESEQTKIIILHGIAGIGKTTLAAKALEELMPLVQWLALNNEEKELK